MLSEYKTEIVGISAEVAIADEYGVVVGNDYRSRANSRVVASTRKVVKKAFSDFGIPSPLRHIAEDGNSVDFTLENNLTLSVKSNQRQLGKAAPQNIGQPTAETYWSRFQAFADGIIPEDYSGKAAMFKRVSISRICDLIQEYWNNMFSCDYLLIFYDYLGRARELNAEPQFKCYKKADVVFPLWEPDKFSFTQTLDSWHEGNTLRYCGVSIGEFQVHANRNCFKFRFNMYGVQKIIERGIIRFSTGPS
jgi:hypothetical protein